METTPEMSTDFPGTPRGRGDTITEIPADTGEEVSDEETSSPESPPSTGPVSTEDFERRVNKLCEMMEADPKVMYRLIAETYVNFSSAEMGIRGMFEQMQKQGMMGLMKGALRRGG